MRKIFIALAVISLCAAFSLPDLLSNEGYAEKALYFGLKQFTKEYDTHIDSVLIDGFKTVFEDPSLYASFLKTITTFTHEEKNSILISCAKTDKPGFFKFLSDEQGVVGPNGSETVTLRPRDDDCFDQVTVQYTKVDDKSAELIFTPGNRRNGTTSNCKDAYVIGSTKNYHTITLGVPNKPHKWTLKNLKSENMQAITSFGLRVFKTCDSFSNLIPDLVITLGLFAGGFGLNPDIPVFGSKPTWWQEVLNPMFIQQGTGYVWMRREDKFVDLDSTEVHPGDFVIVTRMDGVDQIIQWGTGSRSGHSVTLLEIDGEMYAVESQDGWYWPKKSIQRNTWKDWKQYAQNAGFSVAVLPLSPESRAKFNNTAAVEWFKTVEGVPYGYHNFIYGWVDTEDKSLPAILDANFVYTLATLLETFIPAVPTSLIGEAVNKRLGTSGLSLSQLYEVMHQKNITVAQVFAMPEQDSWIYSDGPSMVCSAFVTAVWKAGGLFDGMEINATEFTPRDVYQTNFFDKHYKKPEKCLKDGLPYCQIMGKFVMDVVTDGYSTVDPYTHMFEKCPSIPPLFKRPHGC